MAHAPLPALRAVLERRHEPSTSQSKPHMVVTPVVLLIKLQRSRIVTLASVLSIASANGAYGAHAPQRAVLESRRESSMSQPKPQMVANPVKMFMEIKGSNLVTLAIVLSIASANGANGAHAPQSAVLESRREPSMPQFQPQMVANPVMLMITLERSGIVTIANVLAN